MSVPFNQCNSRRMFKLKQNQIELCHAVQVNLIFSNWTFSVYFIYRNYIEYIEIVVGFVNNIVV